ncbi:MAG TPA: DUF4097 family beta strand repeat-containing protein [Pseudonocardiaceae bacterium]|nr:DUF4097 family beta strand repeat-containing protein [Pseudonocardiaceae bacterium]
MATFNTPQPISAVLDIAAGSIRFIATDRTDTAVEVQPVDSSKSRDVKVAEQTKVEFANGVLRVEASAKNQYFGPSGSVAVTVQLPAGSKAEVKAESAEIRTVGSLGDVAVKSEHGTIDVAEAASARLTTVAGDVSVGRLNGPGEIRTSKGDIKVTEAVRGAVVLRTDAGKVEIGAAAGVSATLDAGTSNGRIHNSLNNTEGPGAQLTIQATTATGDIYARSL